MKSVDKLVKIAEKFELKIKQAQISGEDPKSVTTDAFLGPRGEDAFQTWILKPTSNFLQVLPDKVKCNIGAKVDTSKGIAEFLVTLSPPNPKAIEAVKAALVKDFAALHQGKDPVAWQAERLAKPSLDPLTLKPGIVSSHPAIISIT